MVNKIRCLSLLAIVSIFVAACGGIGESNQAPTSDVGQLQIPEGGGRPTIEPVVLTEIANATPTFGPTRTVAPSVNEPLIISTTASQPCREQGDPDTGMSFEQYFANVKCIEPYYPWPMDRQIDFDKYQAMFAGEKGGFGPHFQYSGIQSFHICAWYETWVDAYVTNNNERAGAALEIILNFIPNYSTKIPGYPADMGEGPQGIYLEVAQAAALGDPAPIQSYVDVNCGWLPEWKDGS